MRGASRRGAQVLIPDEQLPELPQELCGIWAYIQWEDAGCPNRSHQDSDAAYIKCQQPHPAWCTRRMGISLPWARTRGGSGYATQSRGYSLLNLKDIPIESRNYSLRLIYRIFCLALKMGPCACGVFGIYYEYIRPPQVLCPRV